MGYAIYIEKKFEKNGIHFYSVLKNSNDGINYSIGLDPAKQQINFFQDLNIQSPVCIYDLQLNKFIQTEPSFQELINIRVIIKAAQAIKENHFPEYISWQS